MPSPHGALLSQRMRSLRRPGAVAPAEPLELYPDVPERGGIYNPRRCAATTLLVVAAVLIAASMAAYVYGAPPTTRAVSAASEPLATNSRAKPLAERMSAAATRHNERTGGRVHVVLASDEERPAGLLAAINSTIVHCATPKLLRFHLILANEVRSPLRLLLERVLPHGAFRTYALVRRFDHRHEASTVAPPHCACILRQISRPAAI